MNFIIIFGSTKRQACLTDEEHYNITSGQNLNWPKPTICFVKQNSLHAGYLMQCGNLGIGSRYLFTQSGPLKERFSFVSWYKIDVLNFFP
jgi:hypothetical protein